MTHSRVHTAVDAAPPRFNVRIGLNALPIVVEGMVEGWEARRLL